MVIIDNTDFAPKENANGIPNNIISLKFCLKKINLKSSYEYIGVILIWLSFCIIYESFYSNCNKILVCEVSFAPNLGAKISVDIVNHQIQHISKYFQLISTKRKIRPMFAFSIKSYFTRDSHLGSYPLKSIGFMGIPVIKLRRSHGCSNFVMEVHIPIYIGTANRV